MDLALAHFELRVCCTALQRTADKRVEFRPLVIPPSTGAWEKRLEGRWSRLTALEISGVAVTEGQLLAVLTGCPRLQRLSVSGSRRLNFDLSFERFEGQVFPITPWRYR